MVEWKKHCWWKSRCVEFEPRSPSSLTTNTLIPDHFAYKKQKYAQTHKSLVGPIRSLVRPQVRSLVQPQSWSGHAIVALPVQPLARTNHTHHFLIKLIVKVGPSLTILSISIEFQWLFSQTIWMSSQIFGLCEVCYVYKFKQILLQQCIEGVRKCRLNP